MEFCDPIRAGGYAGSTPLQKEIAVRTASALQRIVRPFLLRRKKADINEKAHVLPPKTEHVLFCNISPRQREIYQQILASPEVDLVLRKRASAFAVLTTLRKLCNHPALAFRKGRVIWDADGIRSKSDKKLTKMVAGRKDDKRRRESFPGDSDDSDEANESDDLEPTDALAVDDVDWDDSGKLSVLKQVLPLWKSAGHKVLLFSQTQSMLNLIEKLLMDWNSRGYIDARHKQQQNVEVLRGDRSTDSDAGSVRFLRLDGSTPMYKRDGIVNSFNTDSSIFLMLLTTRTGGVGISLTAANRVVILDPDWNPQTDVQVNICDLQYYVLIHHDCLCCGVQARERAWRLGQQREVTIYRLLTRGTIEEKIYQRQIFKLLLSNRILDDPKQRAMFSKTDLKELFTLTDTSTSATSTVGSTGRVNLHKSEEDRQSTLPVSGHVPLDVVEDVEEHENSDDVYIKVEDGDKKLMRITYHPDDENAAALQDIDTSNGFMDKEFTVPPREDGEVGDERMGHSAINDTDASAPVRTTIAFTPAKSSISAVGASTTSSSSSSSSNIRTASTPVIRTPSPAMPPVNSSAPNTSDSSVDDIMTEKKSASLDRKLLIALINGDSISCVYDHAHLENASSTSSLTSTDKKRLVETASKKVKEATVALEESGSRRVLGSRAPVVPRPSYSSSSSSSSFSSSSSSSSISNQNLVNFEFGKSTRFGGTDQGMSSSAMMANLRRHNQSASPATVSNLATTQEGLSIQESLRLQILELFTRRQFLNGIKTEQFLDHFNNLGDQYAVLFRDTLREVATFQDGVWVRNFSK
jgi:hypothetical protein